jgi:uncharacterized membrane protein
MREQSPSPWSLLLGFAFGGFFDGILLHQILQWHHLLSLVAGMDDLRLQILWDGYFHALMYVLAAVALIGLLRSQARGRPWGLLLIGFGLWHVVDGLLSHWLLGIHRIRVDSEIPLLWDLLWFFGFGVLPLMLGVFFERRLRRKPATVAGAPLLALCIATAGLAAWDLKPPPDQPFTTIVFSPTLGPEQVLDTLKRFDARLVWHDPAMGVVVTDLAPERRWALYANGALLVSGSGIPAGCLDWSRI